MKLIRIFFVLFCVGVQQVSAVQLDSANRDEKYVQSILGRSKKIVDKLALNNGAKENEVLNILANRYFLLNDIYERRDDAVKKAKQFEGAEKESRQSMAVAACESELYKSHFAFESNLSLYLDQKQVEAVKDGMTYNVLHVTYQAYQDMIPSLSNEEKVQILAWLTEAREYAINGENSDKKHAVFGKYKGRINNYLAARGYDLQQERKKWYERIEASKNKK